MCDQYHLEDKKETFSRFKKISTCETGCHYSISLDQAALCFGDSHGLPRVQTCQCLESIMSSRVVKDTWTLVELWTQRRDRSRR